MRFAVLGQGSIGRRHARNLLDLGHEVVAWDPAAVPAEGATVADTLEGALEHAEAAIVASPSSEHAAQALLALEHTCHVLIEKPLALSPADVDPIAAAADDKNLVLGVAMNLRFHPAVIAVREALVSGALGRPLVARAWFGSWLPGWRPGTDYRASYSARRELGGGVLLDAVHEIDYLTWILGPVRSVAADLARVSDLELDVEDVATLELEFQSGARAVLSMDYLDRTYDRGCRIVGESGTAAWSWPAGQVRVTTESGQTTTTPVPRSVEATYLLELRAFVEAIKGRHLPSTVAAEARHALEVIAAARVASETGTRRSVAG